MQLCLNFHKTLIKITIKPGNIWVKDCKSEKTVTKKTETRKEGGGCGGNCVYFYHYFCLCT